MGFEGIDGIHKSVIIFNHPVIQATQVTPRLLNPTNFFLEGGGKGKGTGTAAAYSDYKRSRDGWREACGFMV